MLTESVITVGIFPRSPYPNDPKRLLANPKALKGRIGVSDMWRTDARSGPYTRTTRIRTPCTLPKLA
jgi:hypothetical protein